MDVPLEVDPHVEAQIRENPTGISLQVVGASDAEAAAVALERARGDIHALDGGWRSAPNLNPGDRNGPTHVSAVMRLPTGPLISVDGGYTPLDLLATIPSLVARRLDETGVVGAHIIWPESDDDFDWWGAFYRVPRAVALHLSPVAPPTLGRGSRTTVPSSWLEAACTWLATTLRPGDELRAVVSPVVLPFAVEDGPALLEQARSSGSATLVAGDPARRMLAVEAKFIGFQHLSLAGGGPRADDAELLAIFDSLVAVARALGPELGHARLSIEPAFSAMRASILDERTKAGWCVSEWIDKLGDEITYDACPYQILGPGHLRRLADAGRRFGDELRPLGEGRAELTIGEASSWLLDHPERRRVQAEARDLLRPCLATDEESQELLKQKWRRGRGEEG